MKQYYFKSEDGNEYGPITAEEISDWQAQGRMNSESLVRYTNSREWLPLSSFDELAAAPPPAPAQKSEPESEPEPAPKPAPSPSPFASGQSSNHSQPDFVESHRGGLILGLGIGGLVLSIACCCTLPLPIGLLIAIPAWAMGSSDMRKMNAGKMDPTGKGNTKGGLICGIIGTIISLLNLLILIAAVIFEFSTNDFDSFMR
ncbi:MAG: DUF4339 domain-containing protein [Verrucomicrobiales bacterium]|nr:DUF4339 domain-containing protein [Verrucomicrobiales bacterium]